jgi:hypothetical protein
MPIMETTDKIAPRSALRHRPVTGAPVSAGQNPPAANTATPLVKRASRYRQPETGDEVTEWKRDDSDDIKNKSAASQLTRRIPIASTVLPKTPLPEKPVTRKQWPANMHPLLYLGVGMLAMLALIAVLSIVTNWFSTTLDDLRYGRPRTFQIDAYVGHNESPGMPSHFLAVNLHGRIEIIEIPGGDASRARIYIGPQLYGSDADLIPVTLSFIDVNGDHKPDMIINFQGTQVVFINDQGGFRPLRPEERSPVEQFLQHHGQ